jgi:hypothetical protein
MGGPRRLAAFGEPDPSELGALRLEAVKRALELGVDPNAVDLEGRTALDRASDPSIVELLTAHAAAE